MHSSVCRHEELGLDSRENVRSVCEKPVRGLKATNESNIVLNFPYSCVSCAEWKNLVSPGLQKIITIKY